jgi:hypothetical protein
VILKDIAKKEHSFEEKGIKKKKKNDENKKENSEIVPSFSSHSNLA